LLALLLSHNAYAVSMEEHSSSSSSRNRKSVAYVKIVDCITCTVAVRECYVLKKHCTALKKQPAHFSVSTLTLTKRTRP
jgi:hypothetical protein